MNIANKIKQSIFLFFVGFFLLHLVSADEANASVKFDMESGLIRLKTTDIAASTDTRYETTGWFVHAQPRAGNPRVGNFGILADLTETGRLPEPPEPGKLLTSFFELSEMKVRNALIAGGLGNLREGDTFYLSARFQIIEKGKRLEPFYDSLSSIRAAREWANPSFFNQYYDIAVSFSGLPYEANLIIQTEDGFELTTRTIGHFYAGETVNVALQKQLNYGARLFRLQKSYVKLHANTTGQKHIQTSDVLTRNVTMPVGGFQLIAIYNYADEQEARAKIGSNTPGDERYHVEKAIPSGERIFVKIIGRPFLVDWFFQEQTEKAEIDVVFERIQNDNNGHSPIVIERRVIQLHVPFKFWAVQRFQILTASHGIIRNSLMTDGKMTFDVRSSIIKSMKRPIVQLQRHDIHHDAPDSMTVRLEDDLELSKRSLHDLRILAQKKMGTFQVRNDRLVINGMKVVDDRWTNFTAPHPLSPNSFIPSETVLYLRENVTIPSIMRNGIYPSNGSLVYVAEPSLGNKLVQRAVPISPITKVVVHTPLLVKGSIITNRKWVQLLRPEESKSYLVIGHEFLFNLTHEGSHSWQLGYGNRDYLKYAKGREVLFPFDVTIQGILVKKNQWYALATNKHSYTIRLPTWVPEKNYMLLMRTYSESCIKRDCLPCNHKNIERACEMVTETIPVTVVGKLYDFHIRQIRDPHWQSIEDVYRAGNARPYDLPVRPGSHPQPIFKNITVGTGAIIRYRVRTMGDYTDKRDEISVELQYDYVRRDGTGRRKVDLYRLQNGYGFVRMHADHSIHRVVEIGRKSVSIGNDFSQRLPSMLRTFIDTSPIPIEGANDSIPRSYVQEWTGEFGLPAHVLVVPAGFDLTEYARRQRLATDSSVFLRDGYLVVNAQIKTIKKGKREQPILAYAGTPNADQWMNEGFKKEVYVTNQKWTFRSGDILLFDLQRRTVDDISRFITN